MKKTALSCFVILCLILIASLSHAGTITLTTYYPAPFGAYSTMRLVPQTELTGACDPGSLYSNTDASDVLQYCHSNSAWGYLPGVWTQTPTTNQVFLTDMANWPNGMNIGIGTPAPTSNLHIASDTSNVTMALDRIAGADLFFNVTSTTSQITTTGATPIELATDNATRIFISGAGRIGINTTNPDDHQLEVNGDVEITVAAGTDSKIKFNTGAANYSMGIDSSDGYFTISPGSTISTSGVYIKLTNTGLIVNGPISVQQGTDPIGEIKLKYINAGAQSGYYGMYAP